MTFEPSSFDAVTALFCFTHMPRDYHAALLAGFTLYKAEVVEVDEPSGREAWFWVFAQREEP